MPSSSRLFAINVVVCVGMTLMSTQYFAPVEGATQAVADSWVYVGTASYGSEPSRKLYLCRFNSRTGQLQLSGVAAATVNPGFLAIDPYGPYLYAVNEIGNYNGEKSGAVSSFRVDATTGRLSLLNQVSSHGANPSYVTVSANGKFAVVASYYRGVVSFPINADGSLGAPVASVHENGVGVNRERQESSHPHSVILSPDNRFAIAVDLGLDKLFVYRFDSATGSLVPNQPSFAVAPAGAGPRHLAFAPNGRFAYVVNELQSSLTTYSFDPEAGTFHALETLSTLKAGYHGANTAAEVQVAPSGRFVYASNRGRDSIAVFAVNPQNGTLAWTDETSTEGKTPRNFVFDPSGQFILVGDQDSNRIVVFRVDSQTGRLHAGGDKLDVPSPVCITFLRTR